MSSDRFREATEQRKKSELPDDKIEDAARNEISRRFGEGDANSGAARQHNREGSNSLLPDSDSNSVRREVQQSDANADAVDESNNTGNAA